MNRLSRDKRRQIVAALVEGNSIRATCRMTGAAKGTVLRLLADLGKVCAAYQDEQLRGLECKRVQVDEVWSFCYAKESNLPKELKGKVGWGDVYTWTAICADSKIILSWLVGKRDSRHAEKFIQDVSERLANRVQLTSDGHKPYLTAVETVFGNDIDYAMLVKLYGSTLEGEKRYSPAKCIGIRQEGITGNPDPKHISTSFAERQNLTMRMQMRRFTRLTNAFSKKLENLAHAVALHFMWYNFGRIHQTLRVTPAMEAGVSDHVWSLEEVIGLLEAQESRVSAK